MWFMLFESVAVAISYHESPVPLLNTAHLYTFKCLKKYSINLNEQVHCTELRGRFILSNVF